MKIIIQLIVIKGDTAINIASCFLIGSCISHPPTPFSSLKEKDIFFRLLFLEKSLVSAVSLL